MAGSERKTQFVSAVVYVHDAEGALGRFLRALTGALEALFENYEVVCVDDASTDGSAGVIRAVAAERPQTVISVVSLGVFHGVERAMRAGVDTAIGDFVYTFERPGIPLEARMVAEVFERACEGHDVVSAVPAGGGELSSRLFYDVFNRFSTLPGPLGTELFTLLTRRAINRVGALTSSTPLAKAAYASSGLSRSSVAYEVDLASEPAGFSRERRERAIDSLLFYTSVGYQAAKTLSLIMLGVTLLSLVYAVAVFLTGRPVEGWTTTIVLVSFCFAGLFLLMVLIVKYLSLILSQLVRKSDYVIGDIRKVTGGKQR